MGLAGQIRQGAVCRAERTLRDGRRERRVRQGAQGCVPGAVRRGWKSPENLVPDKSADAHLKGSCEQTHDRRETNYAATNLYIYYRQISIQEASHQQISALGLLFCSFFLFIRCRFHHMFFIRLLFKTRFRYSQCCGVIAQSCSLIGSPENGDSVLEGYRNTPVCA